MKYAAKFVKEDDGKYSVSFPGEGMDGCITCGLSFEDAKKNAQEALDLYIEGIYSLRGKIPMPSEVEGDDIFYFSPSPSVEFAVILRSEREKTNLTQTEMAEKAGIAPAMYQRLENPRRANPTLKTIVKLQTALGKPTFLQF